MMSLFSSFDLKFFKYFFIIIIIFLMSNFIFKFFKSSSLFEVLSFSFKFLSNFFYSLTNYNFSKELNFVILNLFILIFFFNLNSIFPFNFPFSSQSSMIFTFSLFFWLSSTIYILMKKKKMFITHLMPEGSPLYLAPFLFLIEIVSQLIRPLTLMIRLVANVLAGHLLIILLTHFIMKFQYFFFFLSMLNMVEIFVAIVQAYIFSTLITLYLSEM